MDSQVITINYFAVVTGAVLSMIIGAIWYGPLFGKKWLEVIGMSTTSLEERKKMQKSAGPLFMIQFLLTLFQILVLAHLIADTTLVSGIERALWIWVAFVMPTLAGAVMWTNDSNKMKLARFLIQGGYQLTMFLIFGILLQLWK